MVHAVLFDFGNTLFAHESLANTVQRAAAELGHEVDADWAAAAAADIERAAHSADELRHQRDLDERVWSQRWRVLYAARDAEVPGLGAVIHGLMHDPAAWVPYARTADVLRALSDAGVPVGLVSNTGWDVRTVFRHQSLAHLVQSFTLSYEAGVVKPSAEIFRVACASLGVEPRDALMVGDDPVADAGAVRVGMPTLLLPAQAVGTDNGLEGVCALSMRR